jgi:serine/threonine protein kinase
MTCAQVRRALKILSSAVSADTVFRERFSREADIAAALSHPHIVGVHDRGEFEGQLWMSMEYVDGTDAARLMRDRYPAGMAPITRRTFQLPRPRPVWHPAFTLQRSLFRTL